MQRRIFILYGEIRDYGKYLLYCIAGLFLYCSFFMNKQIVTLGMPSVSPNERVGKYVKPRDWNALISDPDIVSII